MLRFIGFILLALPFVAVFLACAAAEGVAFTVAVFGITLVLAGCIIGGVELIDH